MTLNDFKKKRLAGQYGFDHVRVWVDSARCNPSETEVVLKDDVNVVRFDARLFYGLSVFLYADQYSETIAKIYEKLKAHAAFILVALVDFGDEIGWKWSKAAGEQQI